MPIIKVYEIANRTHSIKNTTTSETIKNIFMIKQDVKLVI